MTPGDQVGPYRLVERLGRGGMGEVWRADDATGAAGGAPRQVALKLLDPALTLDPDARARFTREVAAARRVRGASVAALLDADVDADQPWLASAYVAGPTLDEHVARHGPMSDSPLRALGAALADALVSIHEAGVVHRDLTPRNVVLGPDGPRVVDFGIAWFAGSPPITRTGSWVGTPAWIPPERLTSDEVTAASDVWSWGAVMAFAAQGRPAVGRASPAVMAQRAAAGLVDLADVPAWLSPWVRVAMDPDPASRPTAEQLLDAMTAVPGAVPSTQPYDLAPTVADAAAHPTVPADATSTAVLAGARAGRVPARAEGTDASGRRRGPAHGLARWASAAVVIGGAVAIGLLGGLLVAVIAMSVLVIAAVVLRVARESRPEGAKPVLPTWSVGLAGPVVLATALVVALGPIWGVAVMVAVVMLFFVLGGDIG